MSICERTLKVCIIGMDVPISILDLLKDNERLQKENALLTEEIEHLRQELAQYRQSLSSISISQLSAPIEPDKSSPMFTLSSEEKVALFRSIFRGREDVVVRRWYIASSGKSGY